MHRARSFLGSLAATNVWFLCHLGQSPKFQNSKSHKITTSFLFDFILAFMTFFRRQFKNHFVWWGIGIQVKKRASDCFMHRARSFLGSLAATNVWFLCHLGQSGWWISHEETTVLYSMTITKGPKNLWNRHIFLILCFVFNKGGI